MTYRATLNNESKKKLQTESPPPSAEHSAPSTAGLNQAPVVSPENAIDLQQSAGNQAVEALINANDGDKTPSPGGPIPIPYPNVGGVESRGAKVRTHGALNTNTGDETSGVMKDLLSNKIGGSKAGAYSPISAPKVLAEGKSIPPMLKLTMMDKL